MSKIIAHEFHDMRMKHWRAIKSDYNSLGQLVQQYNTEEFGLIEVRTRFTDYNDVQIQTIYDLKSLEEDI